MRTRQPALCSPTTRIALTRLAKAGVLPADDAALLIRADHVWRTVQGMLRITVGRGAREKLPDASAQALLRAVAEALDTPARLTWRGCAPRWMPWRSRSAPRSSDT